MPSALLAPANILQSFPAPLGRRGTVAVAVIGLHLLFLSALIAGLVVHVTIPTGDGAIVGEIIEREPKTLPPRTAPTPLTAHDFYDDAVMQPPTDAIPVFEGPSTAPTPSNVGQGPTAVTPEPLSPPRVLKQLDPLYPAAERRAEHEGTVVVRVLIGEDGRAQQVEVAGSSGYPGLDAAAVASVKRWTFAPARNGAGPVAGWASVKVRFQIDRS